VKRTVGTPPCTRPSSGFTTVLVAISLLIGLGLVEVFLRVAPGTIGIRVLAHFPSPLRRTIAVRLGLPTINDYVVITTEERADKGPPLPHPRPNSVFRSRLDQVDVQTGALETVQLDSHGFCNPPRVAERTSADVVTIGDSLTFCTSVKPEDTATAILEREIGKTTYNLGVPGIGMREYLELFRKYGMPLNPEVVIMNVYEGNDLRDADRFEQFIETGHGRDEDDERLQRIVSNSYAASLAWAGVEWVKKDSVLGNVGKVDFTYSGLSKGQRVAMNVTNADTSEPRSAQKLTAGEISLGLWEDPLEEFMALSHEAGFTPVVAYIPSMYTAYATSVQFGDTGVGERVQQLSAQQREWLASKTAKLGVVFVDTTRALQAAAETGPLTHFPANVHLTPFGHEIVAREWRNAVERARPVW
jgi:hypothetical protein